MNKSASFRAILPLALLHLAIHSGSAQAPAAPPAPAVGQMQPAAGQTQPAGGQSQQSSAFAAMQASLAQQQSSVDTFRSSQQAASLDQQRQSVIKQVGPTAPMQPISAPASPAKPDAGSTQTADAAKPPAGFFTAPWPSDAPLSVPNVQVVDDSCEALGSSDVGKLVDAASKKHGIDAALLTSVMRQESAFKPCATSVAGAMGLMQIMPDTAEMLGLDEPYNAEKNVDAGAKFLKMMLDRYQGDLPMALGAYNAGPGTVDKAGGVPPIAETVQYISNVLGGLPLAY